jgi:hypothetical protein
MRGITRYASALRAGATEPAIDHPNYLGIGCEEVFFVETNREPGPLDQRGRLER